ncbi:glycoside hydrolase family 30 protein [Microthyrium microscopicum]|uniref:glucan endo-1,6-beta-glucosidase n=1 Tax=Microthyrium microscopicum TaxID=703497 RepID=A0A6A6UNQ8_9PEZI|nr:glycoside hydrolase family 30 protein [Microthyrium microscopicum]
MIGFVLITALVIDISVAVAGPVADTYIQAAAFCSSSDAKYKLSQFDPPVKGSGTPNGMSLWQLQVDDTTSGYKQKVTGFGAAVTDATVAVLNRLASDKKQNLLKQLMTSDGVNFSLMRHTVASSDLSSDPVYTYDDNGGNVDASISSFNLGGSGRTMAATLKSMRALNPGLTILGSTWSPPGWMKLNKLVTGTTVNNNLNLSYVKQYAQYFVKYLQAYEQSGAHIDAITIQNEPLNSKAGFPTMYISASQAANLIQQNIGPALKNASLATQIWAYDHNTDEPDYPDTIVNAAPRYVQATAWHCYAANNKWSVLTDFHNKHPGIQQYMTECWTSPYTGWSQAADFTMGPLQNWASGSMAWTLGSDTNYGPHLADSDACGSCRGLFVVDTSAGTYDFAIDYYMMGQFSKFIPKGATILAGTGSWTYDDGTGLQSVASVNPDGCKTVVITNKFQNDVYVTVNFKSGSQWSGRVYKESVVTWTLLG